MQNMWYVVESSAKGKKKSHKHWCLLLWNILNTSHTCGADLYEISIADTQRFDGDEAGLQVAVLSCLIWLSDLHPLWDCKGANPSSEPLNPGWPGAGETRGSWRMNHRHVNHIRCLPLFLLLFTSTACVPHLIGTKAGQTRGKRWQIRRQLGRSSFASDEEASQLSPFAQRREKGILTSSNISDQ